MTDAQIQYIIREVVQRIIIRKGANGKRGSLIVVFTGVAKNLGLAISEVRRLVVNGFKIKLALSENAEKLYGSDIQEMLLGYPHVSSIDKSHWIEELKMARAVTIPLLSLNSLSRVALLIADTLASQLIVHALLMNKPVLAAQNDIYFSQGPIESRIENQSLNKSILHRIEMISNFGCKMTELKNLSKEVNQLFQHNLNLKKPGIQTKQTSKTSRKKIRHKGKVVTAAQIRQAHMANADLILAPGVLISPLANDIATTQQVSFFRSSEK